jgi:hypothetical protein
MQYLNIPVKATKEDSNDKTNEYFPLFDTGVTLNNSELLMNSEKLPIIFRKEVIFEELLNEDGSYKENNDDVIGYAEDLYLAEDSGFFFFKANLKDTPEGVPPNPDMFDYSFAVNIEKLYPVLEAELPSYKVKIDRVYAVPREKVAIVYNQDSPKAVLLASMIKGNKREYSRPEKVDFLPISMERNHDCHFESLKEVYTKIILIGIELSKKSGEFFQLNDFSSFIRFHIRNPHDISIEMEKEDLGSGENILSRYFRKTFSIIGSDSFRYHGKSIPEHIEELGNNVINYLGMGIQSLITKGKTLEMDTLVELFKAHPNNVYKPIGIFRTILDRGDAIKAFENSNFVLKDHLRFEGQGNTQVIETPVGKITIEEGFVHPALIKLISNCQQKLNKRITKYPTIDGKDHWLSLPIDSLISHFGRELDEFKEPVMKILDEGFEKKNQDNINKMWEELGDLTNLGIMVITNLEEKVKD